MHLHSLHVGKDTAIFPHFVIYHPVIALIDCKTNNLQSSPFDPQSYYSFLTSVNFDIILFPDFSFRQCPWEIFQFRNIIPRNLSSLQKFHNTTIKKKLFRLGRFLYCLFISSDCSLYILPLSPKILRWFFRNFLGNSAQYVIYTQHFQTYLMQKYEGNINKCRHLLC